MSPAALTWAFIPGCPDHVQLRSRRYHYSRFMHLGGLALRGKPAKTQQGDVFISVTSNGFSVSDEGHDNGCSVLLNYSEYVYYYVVFS